MQLTRRLRDVCELAVPTRSLSLSGALWLLLLAIPGLAQTQTVATALPNAPSAAQPYVSKSNVTDHSLTFGERARIYRRSVFSLETAIGPALGAGINQWEGEPPGWREGAEGYGKRFGSGAARSVISDTIRFGFAAVDGEDPRYFPSENRGVWGRAKHAVGSVFVSQTASGRRIPAFSRFVGTYGAAFTSNLWYPDDRATAVWAARRGSSALAGAVGWRLLTEFVPRLSQ